MRRLAAIAVAAACCLCAGTATAEKVVISLSSHRIAITSNFVGENLVLFGAVEPSTAGEPLHSSYDVVATITGPERTYRTQRKARVLGIWVNVQSRDFFDVPAYLAVLANRPLERIASAERLRTLQLGLNNVGLKQRAGMSFSAAVPDDMFRLAFLSLQSESGFYSEEPEAATFLTPTVFRAEVPLPAQVPTGIYSIDVKLFAEGRVVAEAVTNLDIIKAGFEQYIASAARDHGLLYGLAATFLALFTGWFASVVFRRD